MRDIRTGTRGTQPRRAGGKLQPRQIEQMDKINAMRQRARSVNAARPNRSALSIGQDVLSAAGFAGAAHPLRRIHSIPQGGPMTFPLGGEPKLPGFMMDPIRPAA